MRILMCTVFTVVTLLAAPAAMAERDDGPKPNGWLAAVDLVLVRPPSFVVSLASTGVFVATLPITYPTGAATGPESLSTWLLKVPWRFTTSRHYGNFTEYRDNRTIWGASIPE